MPLKRITADVEERQFGDLQLWRDDLEEIVRTIRKVVPEVEITVDGTYRRDEVSDLDEYPKAKLSAFRVADSKESVVLSLSGREALMSLTDASLNALGMATEVERIVAKRRRILFGPILKVGFWYLILLSICVFWFLKPGPDGPDKWILLAASVTILAVIMGGFLTTLRFATAFGIRLGSAILIAKTQEEAPPWLKRNKDALVTNAVVSFVFLIAGIIIGYVIPK